MSQNLPDISFCETDTAAVESSIITTYESIAGQTLYPGDPVRLFLEALAVIIGQQRVVIDTAGKNNLLSLAGNAFLDHLGYFVNTPRLEKTAAVDTVRFSIDSALAFAVAIDQRTRVSPDGKLFFHTTEYAEISAGQTSVDVPVECQTSGTVGNGFVAGQINKLVDPVPYITGVTNLDGSTGGADEEDADPYRERIHTAPESFSVAGPTLAYAHHAKSTNQKIIDVSVFREQPLDDLAEAQLETILDMAGVDYTGMDRDQKQTEVALWLAPAVVKVCPLMDDGLPTSTVLDEVETALNDRKIRPLTDQVVVEAPTQVAFDVDVTYYILTGDSVTATEIQAAVDAAVDAYLLWQQSKLGRDINPDKLRSLVMDAGAKRIDVTSPAYTPVDVAQVAALGTNTVNYGGLEDE